jgi:HK97 family phage portal protein
VPVFPWKRPSSSSSGESLAGGSAALGAGGGLPPSGYTGDLAEASELIRRKWEQGLLDSGSWGGQIPWGFAPWVSEWAARQVPALTACLRLISGVIMQMTLQQKRGPVVIDPAAAIIQNPAPGPNRCLADYVDEYTSDVLLYGNHVALIGPLDSTGWPAMLIPLDVTTVSVARDPATYQPIYMVAGFDEVLPSDRVFHVALDKRSGELRGRGLIPTLSGAIGGALAADSYAGRYFTDGGMPAGVITDTRPNLTQEQASDLKAKWLEAVNASRGPVVIPSSTSFQPLATNAEQAQMIQARQWDATTIAMILGVPPFMLGIETQRHTYTNAENEFGRFVRTTIMRLLRPLEQQLSLQCLPRGNVAAFNTAQLMRPDTLTRLEAAQIGYSSGLLTQAEARELAGYEPEGGPDAPPEKAGAVVPAASPSASGAARLRLLEGIGNAVTEDP